MLRTLNKERTHSETFSSTPKSLPPPEAFPKLVGFTEQASGARVRDKRERDDGNTPLSLIIR